ncbi:fatty-acyl-CoA synthase [Solimonas aquatica]|uniref:Fatty-acyl-CoA synthase n=1 Tax=Solimonas aquatica TaxID=489703 RepID=A0A1H9CGV5_9GAMM|nr:3-(methylthio)propionyl-CoA ligase [Solimonas aquatica]SEP99973.1 fatty-acyl-CoA synthase [Solimonas aquatica]
MLGQMMRMPLNISALLQHAERYHGDTEIVSRSTETDSGDDGSPQPPAIQRYAYATAARRCRQLACALQRLGVREGQRIATLAWNGYRHFELYFSISGIGAITHTINPRLFLEQIAWIVNHAEDSVLCFDLSFSALVARLQPLCPSVRHWVAMCDRQHMPALKLPGLLCYEELLSAGGADFEWPLLDEELASGLCYTSGTTGNPKGVLYSHRSTLLHALTASLPDVMNLSARDCVLPVVPMFHVNAWGIPFLAPLVGAKLVFPGAALDGASLHQLFEQEQVSFAAGVPTVWLGLLQYLQSRGLRLSSVPRMIVGGAACPPALMQAYAELGVKLQHAWGMTELSPLGTVNTPKRQHEHQPPVAQAALAAKQGRPPFGIELKVVDGLGVDLPHDGQSTGELMVRGHWVAERYFRAGTTALRQGWFATGDVANLDLDGFLQITDRSKDVIKSGGEWISSIELENIAMSHPAVAEAAALGMKHPKWDERPLLIVVKKPAAEVDRRSLLSFYQDRVAKWWIPDDVLFLDALPYTANGKLSKLQLRQQLGNYQWPAQS